MQIPAPKKSRGLDPTLADLRARIRHSAAHVMADAVMQLFPDAKLGFGPPTDDGFYYDIDVSRPFTPEDLDKITGIMKAAIAKNWPFIYKEHPRDEIKALHHDQPYKLELID